MKLKLPKLSIFFKLILTVFVFGLLLNMIVIFVFRLSTDDKPRKYLRDFTRRMEHSIVTDIGIPPDTVKAKQICEDLDIEMRFESHEGAWSSSEKMPTLGDILMPPGNREEFLRKESFIVRYNEKRYSIFKFPNGVFIIEPFNPDMFKPERAILLMILFISILIIILSLFLRRLFKPLKDLSLAVEQIGDGNYNVKIPAGRKDELGELAESINEMSGKISSSIKAKEQLLIDVSHELRSPLTRIKLGLEVGSPKEKIEEDINEMERMISGLLESYRNDTSFTNLKIEKVNVVELLEDTISEYDVVERLKLVKQQDEIYFNADFEKLQIVFRNLIDNALKYSNDLVKIESKEQMGDVWISFKDNGVGISEKDLKLIFEPFYRADPSRSRKTGGFGLGLSICKKIMDAHNGEIIINSQVSEGTEVVLKLKAV
ncbi:MAG: HAMP domain-containing histidine kinase [Chlorobi bacterium]|nr:HAMP domain-containing histidine kinase [Chlorobiota bacterium]MCI0716879.1 HAMP domain-containing histidine kinase [Chlorobiota bacterium]